jgi:hypothetical protein
MSGPDLRLLLVPPGTRSAHDGLPLCHRVRIMKSIYPLALGRDEDRD